MGQRPRWAVRPQEAEQPQNGSRAAAKATGDGQRGADGRQPYLVPLNLAKRAALGNRSPPYKINLQVVKGIRSFLSNY